MTERRKETQKPTAAYLEKARLLSEREIVVLKQCVQGRFERRVEDRQKSPFEILALQLAFEDAQLAQWRTTIRHIRSTVPIALESVSPALRPARSIPNQVSQGIR